MKRGRALTSFSPPGQRAPVGRTAIALLVLGATAPRDLAAQWRDPSSETLIYATLGAGVANLGVAAHAGLSVRVAIGEFTLRAAGVRSADLLGSGEPNAHDVALLYGVRLTDGTAWLSAGVGPARAWTTSLQCDANSSGSLLCSNWVATSRDVHPGLAFQLARGWRGISLGVLGDVNAARSFVAATFNVHVGKVR